MITTTHRQYLKPSLAELDTNFSIYNLAEFLVDNYVGVKSYAQINGRANQANLIFESADFTISATTVTLTDKTYSKNAFKFCVIQVLEGVDEGLLVPVLSSDDNILTIATNNLLNFTTFKIYQIGNFPRTMDITGDYRTIPNEIKQATQLLFNYLVENESVVTGLNLKSESQSTSSYSYTLADNSQNLLLPIQVTSLLNKFV